MAAAPGAGADVVAVAESAAPVLQSPKDDVAPSPVGNGDSASMAEEIPTPDGDATGPSSHRRSLFDRLRHK